MINYKNNKNIKKLADGVWSAGNGSTKVVISGCVHGNEKIGINVINDLINKIDFDKIRDIQIIFMLLNLEGMDKNKRFIDVDMNRIFSIENIKDILKGKSAKEYENKRLKEVLPFLEKTDYLFDIHSTNLPSIPFVYCSNTSKHLEIASLFKTKYIVCPTEEILDYKDFFCGFDNYIDRIGGVGVTIEAGSISKSSLEMASDGIINFLITKKFYLAENKNSKEHDQKIILLNRALFVKSEKCNFLKKDIKNFDFLKKGDCIAMDGDIKINADADCYIIFPKSSFKKSSCYGILGMLKKNMTNKIWSNKKNDDVSELINKYIFSKNLESDNKLLPYDIRASIAHVNMLSKIGVVTKKEQQSIVDSLNLILELHNKKDFNLEGFEDCHSAIESFLIEKIGDAGKKIHTGRSRNDQVLVALRLFTKKGLLDIKHEAKTLSKSISDFAKSKEFTPLPGFTHMQYAMPSSIGHWAGSFLESLLNDLYILENGILINNQNPLGSAAGFGTSINIDRSFTTKELGFEKIQKNTLFCQNSRGKFETYTISCLYQIMMTLSKMANDIIIFSSQEFSYLTLSDKISTGSSIMPQKRNPDPLEVMRGNCSKVFSYVVQMVHLSNNLISGYNKDFKFTKDAIIDSINITQSSLKVMNLIIKNISVNEKKLQSVFEKNHDIFAADIANDFVLKKNIPFRDAYLMVKEKMNCLDNSQIDISKNLKSKKHIGATGNLCINEIMTKIFDL